MSTPPKCPKCSSELSYDDGSMYVCPECAHEWSKEAAAEEGPNQKPGIRDAVGNVLQDGDTVTVIKDLKVKGSSITLKIGTKVKSIRLVGGDHEVDCKMDGGNFMLKACYLKKV